MTNVTGLPLTTGVTGILPIANGGTGSATAIYVLLTAFVDGEVPSGIMDSSNPTFTIANTPITGSVQVFWNGIKLRATVGYTIIGTTITMTTPPDNGDVLEVYYRK